MATFNIALNGTTVGNPGPFTPLGTGSLTTTAKEGNIVSVTIDITEGTLSGFNHSVDAQAQPCGTIAKVLEETNPLSPIATLAVLTAAIDLPGDNDITVAGGFVVLRKGLTVYLAAIYSDVLPSESGIA